MSDAGSAGVIAVRPARPEDAPAVAALAAELRAHLGDPLHHLTPEAIVRDGFGPQREFDLLIAEVGGAPAGYALYYPVYEPSHAARGLYLADLCVTAARRRHGIGRALIDGLTQVARTRGRSFIWWHTRPENESALAFYRSLDLDIIEPFVVHVRLVDGD